MGLSTESVGSSPEGVCDGDAFNLLSVPQVFAVEGLAARFERGSNDQAVVEAESITRLDVQG